VPSKSWMRGPAHWPLPSGCGNSEVPTLSQSRPRQARSALSVKPVERERCEQTAVPPPGSARSVRMCVRPRLSRNPKYGNGIPPSSSSSSMNAWPNPG
jgi:hypothetical protein